MGRMMEKLWSRRIHVVLERHPSGNDAALCSCAQIPWSDRTNSRTLKRKVGLRKLIRHLSLDVQNAGTVCPMVTDALEHVREIFQKKKKAPSACSTVIGEECRGLWGAWNSAPGWSWRRANVDFWVWTEALRRSLPESVISARSRSFPTLIAEFNVENNLGTGSCPLHVFVQW